MATDWLARLRNSATWGRKNDVSSRKEQHGELFIDTPPVTPPRSAQGSQQEFFLPDLEAGNPNPSPEIPSGPRGASFYKEKKQCDVDESINDISVVTESNIDEVLSTVRLPMHDSVASLEGVVNDDDNDVDPLCWSWMRECAGRAFNAVTGVIKTGLCGLVAGYGILDATPSNEETAGVVDTAVDRCGRFAELASKIPVRDLPPDEVLHQDSANQIAVDVARLRGDSTMAEKILQEFVELYPNVGYNQGGDWSLLAILSAVGDSYDVALRVFVKWAVTTAWVTVRTIEGENEALFKAVWFAVDVLDEQTPSVVEWLLGDKIMNLRECAGSAFFETLNGFIFLRPIATLCSTEGFDECILNVIIEKTLEYGEDGPAVSLWVITCLLNMSYQNAQSMGIGGEIKAVAHRMSEAAQCVRTFQDLENSAPLPLTEFIRRFRIDGKLAE